MNAEDRSELMCKLRDWICEYHNENDNKGFEWKPNIVADVWYEILKEPVKEADTMLCKITIRDRDASIPTLLLLIFYDDDFVITRKQGWPFPPLYRYLVPRITNFLIERGGAIADLT